MSKAILVLSTRKFRSSPVSLKIDGILFCHCSIAVHPGGTSYASGGEDGFVRVHHFDDSYFKAKPYGDLEIID